MQELGESIVPPNNMGRVAWEDTNGVLADNIGICRTDACDTEGNYNFFEYPVSA